MSTNTADTPQTSGLEIHVIVAAYNEAPRIEATLAALAAAFPGAPVWVADDGSTDATSELARQAGARVVRSERMIGKGAAATLAARDALQATDDAEPIFVLCDGDLAESASRLGALADAVRRGDADMAVAAFATRVGGGVGLAVAIRALGDPPAVRPTDARADLRTAGVARERARGRPAVRAGLRHGDRDDD